MISLPSPPSANGTEITGLLGNLSPAPAQPTAPTGRHYQAYTGDLTRFGQGGEHQFFINNSRSNLQPATTTPTAMSAAQALYSALSSGPSQRNAWESNGGPGGNFGIGGLSNATDLGGFLSSTLGDMATVATMSPLVMLGMAYGIVNNGPTFGYSLGDALGLSDWGGGGGDPKTSDSRTSATTMATRSSSSASRI